MTDNDVKTFLLDVQLRGRQAINEMFFSFGGENLIRYCMTKKYIKRESFINNPPPDEPIVMWWSFKLTKKGLKHVSMR